jgi:hypothetical protein
MCTRRSCIHFLYSKNKVNLVSIIKNIGASSQFGNKELNEVREAVCQYPYFQMGYAIIAKQDKSNDSIQKAAIYATDRSYLKALLNCTPPFDQCLLDKKDFRSVPSHKTGENNDCLNYRIASKDVASNHFINGYIDDIFKRTPKNIIKTKSRLQYAIISKFIKANVKFQPKSIEEELNVGDLQSHEELEDSGIGLNSNLATERLAEILLSQGKAEAALDVYEKVIIGSPHKNEDLNHKIKTLKQNK